MGRPRKIENTFNAPKSNTKFSEGSKSAGILDDYAVRKNVDSMEGTIQQTPTLAKHITNKAYVDSLTTNHPHQDVNTTATPTFAGLNVDNININGAAITSDTGAISFNDENLTTTGYMSLSYAHFPLGTPGSILFLNSTNDGAEDNDNFFWDNTNKRLGVGTSTPDTTLDINGNAKLQGTYRLYFDDTGEGLYSPAAGIMAHETRGFQRVMTDTNDNDGATAESFSVWTGDTYAGGTGTNLLWIQKDGNVGIGTNTPNNVGHFKSSVDGGGVTIQRDSATAGQSAALNFKVTTTDDAVAPTAIKVFRRTGYTDNDMIFHVGGTNVMTLDDNGGVGIGTTTPNKPIHIHEASSGDARIQFTNTTTGTNTNDGILFGMGAAEQVQLWNFENSFIQIATNNIERMRILSTGNIGINDDNPPYMLNVNVAARANDGIAVENDDGVVCRMTAVDSTTDFGQIGTASNHQLRFIANSAAKMTIDTDGDVGIGTTTPSKKLDVNGDISLEAGSGDYYSNDGSQGWTGTFTNGDGDTVTVKNGIITDVS